MSFRRLLFLFVVLLFAAGCGKTSFLGKRYDNFTAYYNTFYNAKKEYRTGVEAIERTMDQDIDRYRYLQIFPAPERVTSQQNFDLAIKKSADVLRENPTSKWVDDALMLIGKSYFYLQNFVGAEQKFQEVIGLGGALEDEARFWLARTLIAANAYTRAAEHLEASLNREGLSSRWEPMLRLALGELHVRQESWGEAAVELERALERMKDRQLAGRAQFLLAQVYETLGQYENASQAYARVLRYKPDYPLAYASQISLVRLEGQHGDPERALRLLRSMERDDKNFEKRAEMMYFRGRIYQAMGDADRAYDTYHALLFSDDRTLNAASIRGQVHYALGELYRDHYVDFVYASAHFDTARTALGALNRNAAAQGARVQYTPEAIVDGDRQADIFGSYARVHEQIVRLDSLLWLGAMDQEAFDAFILDLRRQRARELAEQQRTMERRQAEQQFQNISRASGGPVKQIDGPSAGQPTRDQGFLFHKDQIRVQEGRITFISLWGERPRVPNWRRLEAVESVVAAGDAGETGASPLDAGGSEMLAGDLLPVVDFSDVPRDPQRRALLEAERALVRYELGNVLFLSMERPDSAAAWYRMVIEETPDLPVAQRAYYALAEVQRALGDQDSARRLYSEVLEKYPDSDFADKVRERLGLAPVERPTTDSLALAEAAYDQAYRLWQEQQYEEAVTNMVLLASNTPAPEIAPRALLATGRIYLEWAERDRLDVHALPPPAVPDSLLLEQGLVDSTYFHAPAGSPPPADSVVAPDPVLDRIQAYRAQVDSLRRVADRLSTRSDSLYVLSDRYYGASDSLQAVSDSLYSLSESLQLQSQLLYLRADSLEGVASSFAGDTNYDEMALDRESPPSPVSEHTASNGKRLRLERVFATIKERFPQSPHAAVADLMLRALLELRPGQDSTLVVALQEEDMLKELEAMPPEERYLRDPAPFDTSAEGWTLVVGSFADAERAESLSAEYREKGYRTAVIKGATRYRVAVGQFPTLDDARSALKMFKDAFPPTTWFLDIQKPR